MNSATGGGTPPKLVTKEEAAGLLRVTGRSIQNFVRRGWLAQPVRVGSKAMFRPEDIEAFMQARRGPHGLAHS